MRKKKETQKDGQRNNNDNAKVKAWTRCTAEFAVFERLQKRESSEIRTEVQKVKTPKSSR